MIGWFNMVYPQQKMDDYDDWMVRYGCPQPKMDDYDDWMVRYGWRLEFRKHIQQWIVGWSA